MAAITQVRTLPCSTIGPDRLEVRTLRCGRNNPGGRNNPAASGKKLKKFMKSIALQYNWSRSSRG